VQSEIAGDRTPRSHHGSATHRFVLRVQVYHSDHLQLDPSSQRTLPCLASSRTYLKKYSVLVVLLVFGYTSLYSFQITICLDFSKYIYFIIHLNVHALNPLLIAVGLLHPIL